MQLQQMGEQMPLCHPVRLKAVRAGGEAGIGCLGYLSIWVRTLARENACPASHACPREHCTALDLRCAVLR